MLYQYCYPVQKDTNVRVVDGDTLDCVLDKGHGLTQRMRLRLENIDTPEIFGTKDKLHKKAGMYAKMTVETILSTWFPYEGVIMVCSNSLDKYGRSIGDMFHLSNPFVPLTKVLIDLGVCKITDGKSRATWTDEELTAIIVLVEKAEKETGLTLKRSTE